MRVTVGRNIFAALGLAALGAAAAPAQACEFMPVSQHVAVMQGATAECPIHANISAIFTGEGVVLVDPGGSPDVAELAMARLRDLTGDPVVAIFNTHIDGRYWLGNAAVAQRYPDVVIYAHGRMVERLREGEDSYWTQTVLREGAEAARTPTVPLFGHETLYLGGLRLKAHHAGPGYSDHDLMIEVVNDKVLILGGVSEQYDPGRFLPEPLNLTGQQAEMGYALNLPIEVFVPARGPAGGPEIVQQSLTVLTAQADGTAPVPAAPAAAPRPSAARAMVPDSTAAVTLEVTRDPDRLGVMDVGLLRTFVVREELRP